MILSTKKQVLLDRLIQYIIQCKRRTYNDISDNKVYKKEILPHIILEDPETIRNNMITNGNSVIATVNLDDMSDEYRDRGLLFLDMCKRINRLWLMEFNIYTSGSKDNIINVSFKC